MVTTVDCYLFLTIALRHVYWQFKAKTRYKDKKPMMNGEKNFIELTKNCIKRDRAPCRSYLKVIDKHQGGNGCSIHCYVGQTGF